MKAFGTIVTLFVLGVIAFLYLSIFGVFTNDLTAAAATATQVERVLGYVFGGLAVLTFLGEAFQFTPIKSTVASVILMGVMLALSVLSFCGFFVAVY